MTRRLLATVLVGMTVFGAGCRHELNTWYGRRSPPGQDSINGTAVLASLFEQAGHSVYSWSKLTPRLKTKADCIVWFPGRLAAPSEQVCDWLEQWLGEKGDRTLIYVVSDYDAEQFYWESVLPRAPADQQKYISEQIKNARESFKSHREAVKWPLTMRWATLRELKEPKKVDQLSSRNDWSLGVEGAKSHIQLSSSMRLPRGSRSLLLGNGETLVGRHRVRDSQILLVANGSFLLNLPLVNHEHRKLAGRLIESVGERAKTVAFLESYGDPRIASDDPPAEQPSLLDIFTVWPINCLLLHLAALGLVYAFSRWPIFGRPRRLPPPPLHDFRKHLDAVAAHLKRSRAATYQYAKTRWQTFREKNISTSH